MIKKWKPAPRRWLIGSLLIVAALFIWGVRHTRTHNNRWVLPDGSSATLQKTTLGNRHAYVIGGPLGQIRWSLSRSTILSRLGVKAPIVFTQNRPNDAVTFWFRLQAGTNHSAPVFQTSVIEKSTGLATRATALSCFPAGADGYVLAATFENYPWYSDATIQLALWNAPLEPDKWLAHPFPIGKLKPPTGKPATAARFSITGETDKTWQLKTIITGVASAPSPPNQPTPFHDFSMAIFRNQTSDSANTDWMPMRIEGIGKNGGRFQTTGKAQRTPDGELSLLFQQVMWPTESPWQVRTEFIRVGNFTANELWAYRIEKVRSALTHATTEGNLATNHLHGRQVRIVALQPGAQPGQGLLLSIELERPDNLNLTLIHARTGTGDFLPVHLVATSGGNGTILKVFGLGPATPADRLELLIAASTNRSADFIVTPELATGKLP